MDKIIRIRAIVRSCLTGWQRASLEGCDHRLRSVIPFLPDLPANDPAWIEVKKLQGFVKNYRVHQIMFERGII